MAKAKEPEQPYALNIIGYSLEDPESLLAHPLNPKLHPKAQSDALDAAMKRVGILAPVLINDVTQHCLDGHERIGIWIAAGQTQVPVIHVNVPEEDEGLVLATFDPIGSLAVTDQSVLDSLIDGIDANAVDQTLVSFLASIRSDAPVGGIPPEDFPSFDENIETEHECPKCGYRWSGVSATQGWLAIKDG